jgi:hypothetical protein
MVPNRVRRSITGRPRGIAERSTHSGRIASMIELSHIPA